MVLFYDPVDDVDQLRVEEILQRGSIEYALGPEKVQGAGPLQILVAEEDLPRAEKLLLAAQE